MKGNQWESTRTDEDFIKKFLSLSFKLYELYQSHVIRRNRDGAGTKFQINAEIYIFIRRHTKKIDKTQFCKF